MSGTIVIIDTSVFVEILAVPGKAQAVDETHAELDIWIESDAALLLPMAVIIETGNHLAHRAVGAAAHFVPGSPGADLVARR